MSRLGKRLFNKSLFQEQSVPQPEIPTISMDTFHGFKDRLLEQYLHDPKFHAIVDRFHCSVRNGDITFDALFGALFLAKEIFIGDSESRIFHDLVHGKEQ